MCGDPPSLPAGIIADGDVPDSFFPDEDELPDFPGGGGGDGGDTSVEWGSPSTKVAEEWKNLMSHGPLTPHRFPFRLWPAARVDGGGGVILHFPVLSYRRDPLYRK